MWLQVRWWFGLALAVAAIDWFFLLVSMETSLSLVLQLMQLNAAWTILFLPHLDMTIFGYVAILVYRTIRGIEMCVLYCRRQLFPRRLH